jgi:hypothetical protein
MDTQLEEVELDRYLINPEDVRMDARRFKKWVDQQVENGCTHFSYQQEIINGVFVPWGIFAFRARSEMELKLDKIRQLEAEISKIKEELKNA